MTSTPETKPRPKWTSRSLAVWMAQLADDKQGVDTVVLDVAKALQVTDYFVITEGINRRHLSALGEHVAKELKTEGFRRMGGTLRNDETWVLLDFGSAVFHAFSSEARTFYDLENLWGDCDVVDWRKEVSQLPLHK